MILIRMSTNPSISAGDPNNFVIRNPNTQGIAAQINFNGSNELTCLGILGDHQSLRSWVIRFSFIFTPAGDSRQVHFFCLKKEFNNGHVWFTKATAIGSLDINGDSRGDLVMLVQTGHAYQPCGVYIVDAFTDAILSPADKITVRITMFALHFETDVVSNSNRATLREARRTFEQCYIQSALEECDGNMSKTAELLGLDRSYLYKIMEKTEG